MGIPQPKTKIKKPSIKLLKKKLWALCREIIRARYGPTCYTCGATGLQGGNWQTGHFITKSTCSTEMAYSLDNLRPQCYHCNINLSGAWVAFESHMIRDGIDVDALKQRNRDTKGLKYESTWYQDKIEEYKRYLDAIQ